MPNLVKKHVLIATAGALMLGTSAVSATGIRPNDSSTATVTRHRTHHAMRHYGVRARGVARADRYAPGYAAYPGPLGLPFAAAQGAVDLGTAPVGAGLGAAGAVVGGTTSALTGNPYGYYGYYGYGNYPYGSYGSYAYAPEYGYAPGSYGSVGLGRDIGHSYYNGFGSPAPASQDNCAGDGGYGRKDYAIGC